MEQDNYYTQEIQKERENQDLNFRAMIKLVAPANEDEFISLYVSHTISSERLGRLTNERTNEIINKERVTK